MSSTSPAAAKPPLSPEDERLYAGLAHFGNIVGFLPSLLIFLLLGARGRFVRDESREALNFSLTALAVWVALAVIGRLFGVFQDTLPAGPDLLFVVLVFVTGLAQLAVWVVVVVLSIIAGLRVQHGGGYRYPLALRLVR